MHWTSSWLLLLAILAAASPLRAQYDDMYYDPDRDNWYAASNRPPAAAPANGSQADEGDYDDEAYAYEDENYDYYYASRIRRFHRPYYGFSYFDPVYVDVFYYDPVWRPGLTTVLIYEDPWAVNSYWQFRNQRRWNNWNSFGWGYNSFGWNNPWNSPWNNPWRNPWNRPFNSWGNPGWDN